MKAHVILFISLLTLFSCTKDAAVPKNNYLSVTKNFYRIFETGDLQLLEETVSINLVDHTPALGVPPGREGLVVGVSFFRQSF